MEQGTGRDNKRFAAGTVAGVIVGAIIVTGALGALRPTSTASPTTAPASGASASTAPASTGARSSSSSPTATVSPGFASPEKGTWFVLVRWMAKSSYTAADALASAASTSPGGRKLVVIDTDQVSLANGKPGQYGVGVIGVSSWAAATAECQAMGLAPGTMCGRYQVR